MASKRKAVKNAEPPSPQKSARGGGGDLQQVESSEEDARLNSTGISTLTRQRASVRTSQSTTQTPIAASAGTKRKSNQNATTGKEGAAEMVVSTNGKKGRQTSSESRAQLSVDTNSSTADVWAVEASASAVPPRSTRTPSIDVSSRGILYRDVPSNSAIEAGFATSSPLSPTTPRTSKEFHRTQRLMELQDAAAHGNDARLTKRFFDDLTALEELSDKDALIDVPDKKENYTPLIWAAKNQKPSTCRLLVELGRANINQQAGWNNNTALMKAAEKGHEDVVVVLLELGADPNLKNSFGNSAVMLAAEFGKEKVIEALINHRGKNGMLVKLNEINLAEYTALILAAEEGHKSCAELLCKSGRVNINAENKFGKSALIMAAEFDRKDVLEVLCAYDAHVNAVSKRGMSALMLASLKGHWEVVDCLIRNNAEIEKQCGPPDGPKDNALTLACSEHLETGEKGVKGKILIVKTLIDKCANVRLLPEGCTRMIILMKACETSSDIVKVLLQWWIKNINSVNGPTQEIKSAKAKEILVLLTAPRKDGTTCLMCAGAKGNIKTMIYLINQLQKEYYNFHLHQQPLGNRSIRGLETDEHLTKLMIRYPTRSEFVKACYEQVEDSKGNTAVKLLVKYYQEHPDRFKEFIAEAASSHQLMYLFHLMPRIVPQFPNPNIIIKMFQDELFPQLKSRIGYHADVKLLNALVNIAAALKIAADSHPLQKHKLNELFDKVENAIEVCMSCSSMDKRSNVAKILQDDDAARSHFGQATIVCEASAFVNGPLALCIKHNLTEFLGTTPISTHVDRVFYASLRSTQRKIIHGWRDIFQVRSGCATLRYCPVFMFAIEGIAKVLYLALVALVSHLDCGSEAECLLPIHFSWFEWSIVVMLVTGILFEIGEMWDRNGIMGHFSDVWNSLDISGHFCVFMWLPYRFYPSHHNNARGWLAWSTIPMSLGLLRFISAYQPLGHLVNVIFAISSDLVSFLIVFFMSIVGFGIAFHSLFPDKPEFADFSSTVRTLFIAALGEHDFLKKKFQNHAFETVGLITMTLYVTFLGIILLNLIIAKMNNTFDSVETKARQQWSMVMAKNVQDCLLIREKNNPLCMLPPPLNGLLIIPPWYFFDWWNSRESKKDRPSICGSVSDFILGLVSLPFCAAVEIILVNRELILSSIDRTHVYKFIAVSLFFPPWYVIFLGLIFWDIIIHAFYKRVRISNRDNNIIYDEETKQSGVGEKTTGGVLEMKIIKFNLKRGSGLFGCIPNVYFQATYGQEVHVSDNKMYDQELVFLSHTFEIKLIDNGKLKLQIFDRHCNGCPGESGGESVLFAESDENDLKEWIANGRFEDVIYLYQPGHARTSVEKTPFVQLAVKIKYPNPQSKSHPNPYPRIGEVSKWRDRLHQRGQQAKMRLGLALPSASMVDIQDFNLISDVLRPKNSSIHRVPGEGNCLFSAVSHQLYNDETSHASVRESCVIYMRAHPDRFGVDKQEHETTAEYFHRMSQDKEWAGHPELQAIVELYGRPIHIYKVEHGRVREEILTDPKRNMADAEPIVLSYINGNHYDSVKPLPVVAVNVNSDPIGQEGRSYGKHWLSEHYEDDEESSDEHAENEPLFTDEDRNNIFKALSKDAEK